MNLYDSSKEFNYELGYVIDGKSSIKKIKEKIIEDDLCGLDNHLIYKGRYWNAIDDELLKQKELIEKKEAQRKEREASKQQILEQQKAQGKSYGFCIRCGEIIPQSKSNAMCLKCYRTWEQWQNYYHPENFCHICGQNRNSITLAKSVCSECSQ